VILSKNLHNLIDKSEIVQRLEHVDFALKTQRQIEKDFSSMGLEFNQEFTSEALDLIQITALVGAKIKDMAAVNEGQLKQLFYLIDIPENYPFSSSDEDSYYNELAIIIVRREAYKVFLRSQF
jgi:hypothetical protein